MKMSKRFYAVQHGEYYECDEGSHIKREAEKMARKLHRKYPEEEIRIVYVTDDSNFAENEIVMFPGSNAITRAQAEQAEYETQLEQKPNTAPNWWSENGDADREQYE